MARERIAQWIEAMKVGPTAKMPEHIIYYRDGVSEGTLQSRMSCL